MPERLPLLRRVAHLLEGRGYRRALDDAARELEGRAVDWGKVAARDGARGDELARQHALTMAHAYREAVRHVRDLERGTA